LAKISVCGPAHGKGFGTAALRRLVEAARAAGYSYIEGEVWGDREYREWLRGWYSWCGFTLDAGGERNRIVYDLAMPFSR
jgi:GNAT superfamily N-acetyltransferase